MSECVKAVIGESVVGCKFQAKAFPSVSPPDLTDFRVTRADPFAVTGIDYKGVLSTKRTNSSRVNIVLFTCPVTWAIQLELVEDLCCTSSLRAFR